VLAVPPPEPAPGVLDDEELLLGAVDELPPAEPELLAGGVVIVADPEVELDDEGGVELGEVELELEEGDVAPGPELLGPPSFPQPASASATAAANSSEVLVIVGPLKKWM
jgi:hypothetical protein